MHHKTLAICFVVANRDSSSTAMPLLPLVCGLDGPHRGQARSTHWTDRLSDYNASYTETLCNCCRP
jgi:hypothetical protein